MERRGSPPREGHATPPAPGRSRKGRGAALRTLGVGSSRLRRPSPATQTVAPRSRREPYCHGWSFRGSARRPRQQSPSSAQPRVLILGCVCVCVCVRVRERREGERRFVFLRSDDLGLSFPLCGCVLTVTREPRLRLVGFVSVRPPFLSLTAGIMVSRRR